MDTIKKWEKRYRKKHNLTNDLSFRFLIKNPIERQRRKQLKDKKRLKEKFGNRYCEVCGKPTKHHHYYCDKHFPVVR